MMPAPAPRVKSSLKRSEMKVVRYCASAKCYPDIGVVPIVIALPSDFARLALLGYVLRLPVRNS